MTYNGTPERCRIWKEAGKDAKLKDLKLNERSDKRQAIVTATYRMEKQDADLNINYIIRPDGAVKVTMYLSLVKTITRNASSGYAYDFACRL